MSAFETQKKGEKKVINWVDNDSSEDENLQEEVEEVDEVEEESNSESEEERGDLKSTSIDTPVAITITSEETKHPKETKDLSNLSKKERKALREKELADLDGILAEFSVGNTPSTANDVKSSNIEAVEATKDESNTSSNKKKNKKKKTSSTGVVENNPTETSDAPPQMQATSDITSILKDRTTKKSKKTISVAEQEALKVLKDSEANEGKKEKKKKTDKKKNYNEMPY